MTPRETCTVQPLYKGTLNSNTSLNNNHHYGVKMISIIQNNPQNPSLSPKAKSGDLQPPFRIEFVFNVVKFKPQISL